MPWNFYTASGALKNAEYVGSEFPAGTIVDFGGTSAPTGWLLCDGSTVSRTTYSSLFNVIGTAYGAGDGSTTFKIPDSTGKIIYATPGLKLGPTLSMALLDSQTFTSSTSYTMPAAAKFVAIEWVGAGGGGGGGGRNTASYNANAYTENLAYGGGGGAGGPAGRLVVPAGQYGLTGTVTVTVGAGGTAGSAAASNGTNGTAGGNGGLSQIGNVVFGYGNGGGAGLSGTAVGTYIFIPATVSGGVGVSAEGGVIFNGSLGAAPATFLATSASYAGQPGRKGWIAGGGGGSGASWEGLGGSVQSGGAGGSNETLYSSAVTVSTGAGLTGGGGTAGTSGSRAGGDGSSKAGGGGGAGGDSSAAGAGGAGGVGAGGGGGGAAINAAAGAGGAGGRAEIKIWVYG